MPSKHPRPAQIDTCRHCSSLLGFGLSTALRQRRRLRGESKSKACPNPMPKRRSVVLLPKLRATRVATQPLYGRADHERWKNNFSVELSVGTARKTRAKEISVVGIMELPRQLSPQWMMPTHERTHHVRRLVVGALGLDVAGLLALVADLLTTSRLLGAVARVVARLAAVVALHAVDALACDGLETAPRRVDGKGHSRDMWP